MRLFIYCLIPFLLVSCSSKKIEKPTKKIEKKIQPTNRLKKLSEDIKQSCQTRVKQHDEYLQINIHKYQSFHKGSHILSKKTKEYLQCIIPFIKDEKDIIIKLNAYSSDKDKKQAQNISDNRAISVAELFYNSGIRDEIFAKGCTKSSYDADIRIFIYPKKKYFKNHCK
jgi:flagellar motor protein MotB